MRLEGSSKGRFGAESNGAGLIPSEGKLPNEMRLLIGVLAVLARHRLGGRSAAASRSLISL